MSFARYTLIILLLVAATFSAKAQSEKRILKEADDAYALGDKDNALVFYLKAVEKNPENARTNFMIGKLYIEIGIYQQRSLKYLEKAFSLNPNVDRDIRRYMGSSYHYNHLLDKAVENYQKYKETLKSSDSAVTQINRKLFECENGKEFMSDPVEAKIENIGSIINTSNPDYAPVISADESILIFTSSREGSTGGQLDEEGRYFEDIYISRKENGKWTAPSNIGTNINTNSHDASIGLSADGKELFIYKSDQGEGDIFYCKFKKDNTWSKPIPMEGNVNTKSFYENAASLSADGKKLFFASKREGGFGGMDIWMVEKDAKGSWKSPVNLGKEINTSGNEESPFMDFDGKTLYFSSKMHKGMGGYDIFKTVYNEKNNKWSTPENLGYPINSAQNDLYFVLSGDGRHGYFSSVKEDGFGHQDIYMITMPPRDDYHELVTKLEAFKQKTLVESKRDSIVPVATPVAVKEEKKAVVLPVLLKGTIFESPNAAPLSAKVQLIDEKGNVVEETVTGLDGKYQFKTSGSNVRKLTISSQKDGYGFTSKIVSVPGDGPKAVELVTDLNLKKLAVGNKFILRNIYYDFDKASLKKESYTELSKLEQLLRDNSAMKVEIGGHTDSKGSDSYNKTLSQKRAESVVKFLIEKGISKERLSAKGYGEEKPLASNDDEDEGRELNRRTEFEVLSK